MVFLRGNDEAQRVALSWPLLTLAERDAMDCASWAQLAGTSLAVVRRLAPMLMAHDICHDDGTVDPMAENWIGAEIQRAMKWGKR